MFEAPKIVQTTIFYFNKAQINIKQEINIAQKLELKLVKNDFQNVMESLEKGRGSREFYVSCLKDVIKKGC